MTGIEWTGDNLDEIRALRPQRDIVDSISDEGHIYILTYTALLRVDIGDFVVENSEGLIDVYSATCIKNNYKVIK